MLILQWQSLISAILFLLESSNQLLEKAFAEERKDSSKVNYLKYFCAVVGEEFLKQLKDLDSAKGYVLLHKAAQHN